MKKIVDRELTFSTDEIKDALLRRMAEVDQPSPDAAEKAEIKMTEDGCRLSWRDVLEIII